MCPNQCIQFRTLGDGPAEAFTPYIRPREQACILCMRCTEACPTDALTPIPDDPERIAAEVRMGIAVVDEDLVPEAFWKPQAPKLDRQGLISALAAGRDIPGAILGNPPMTISVSTK